MARIQVKSHSDHRLDPGIAAPTPAPQSDAHDDAAAVQRVRSRLMQSIAADSVRRPVAVIYLRGAAPKAGPLV